MHLNWVVVRANVFADQCIHAPMAVRADLEAPFPIQ